MNEMNEMNEMNTVEQVEIVHTIERQIIETLKKHAQYPEYIPSDIYRLTEKLIRAEEKLAETQKK